MSAAEYFFGGRGAAERLRVQRIGYRARTLSLPNAVGGVTTLDVTMAVLPTMLAPMKVVDNGCPRRPDQGSAVSLLEQARAGLLATVVARNAMPSAQVLITYEREMSGLTNEISRQTVHIDSSTRKTASFESAHAAIDFVRRGFMETAGSEALFHAPDADVLLNDAFVNAYCFRLARTQRDRVNQVGLAFQVARTANKRVDVDGTLWIDTAARAMRDIEFRYKGLPPEIERLNPGGSISFREMTSGVVLIDRWSLRLVGVTDDTVQQATRGRPPVIRNRIRITETGGELAHATWPDGFKWDGSFGTLSVRVLGDNQLPVSGAALHLVDTDYRGTTDASGTIRIANLLPGPYQLVVDNALLSTIGVNIDTPVKFTAVRDSSIVATFHLKSAEDYVAERCGGGRQVTKKRNGGWVAGRITGKTAKDVDELSVSIAREVGLNNWTPVRDFYTTGTDGLFWICSEELHSRLPVRIEIRSGSTIRQTTDVTLDTFLTVVNIALPQRP